MSDVINSNQILMICRVLGLMMGQSPKLLIKITCELTLKVLVMTIDAQWEGMGDVGSARYEPALLPPCPTIRVLSYSNSSIFRNSAL